MSAISPNQSHLSQIQWDPSEFEGFLAKEDGLKKIKCENRRTIESMFTGFSSDLIENHYFFFYDKGTNYYYRGSDLATLGSKAIPIPYISEKMFYINNLMAEKDGYEKVYCDDRDKAHQVLRDKTGNSSNLIVFYEEDNNFFYLKGGYNRKGNQPKLLPLAYHSQIKQEFYNIERGASISRRIIRLFNSILTYFRSFVGSSPKSGYTETLKNHSIAKEATLSPKTQATNNVVVKLLCYPDDDQDRVSMIDYQNQKK